MYLNCHTYFSLRYGTLSVSQLVSLAGEHQIEALALTDIHNVSACYDFVRECRQKGIHPVIGMEFRRGDKLLYIALAKNLEGFHEINQFYSSYQHEKRDYPDLPPYWSNVYVIYPWARRDTVSLSEHEFLGVRPHELPQLLRSRYRHRQEQLLALNTLSFIDKRSHNIHRLLRAVDHNLLLSKLRNAQQAQSDEQFVPPDKLREIYSEHPKLLRNASRLLSACNFDFEPEKRRTRQTFTGGKYEDMLLLEKLALDGLPVRYPHPHQQKEARRRLESELRIIDQLDFNAYFLITWDFVNYGKSRGFFHVGRGSGANSITAYCLGITDVDPIELDLYFERFLNPRRTSPPDFDIDYSWKDRDDILEYMFRRYRHSHTALLATYNCFRSKATIRELGKVFGLPKREIDLLVFNRKAPLQGLDKRSRQVLHYANLMEGMPNHLSIHAGGILISEKPIHCYTATDMPPKGFPITQFDMYVAEDIGLHKFDVLSQRGLGHIRDSIDIIHENQDRAINIRDVERFKQDEGIKALIRKGETIGCFYVESPAMRGLLTKLQCEDYPTLVAASSIIRPGVSSSGMMRAYIERHNGRLFTYPHPKLKEILHDTYGVMVYQEDVIKVAHHFAGLDLAEADLLRRAMSGKFRSTTAFEQIRERFFGNCVERGYPLEVSEEIWRQIESFAGYSFSKAHSASFAVESFQSLYLKAHYPLEFMTAVINNFGGFYDTELYLWEARKLGAQLHLPCVNHSRYLSRLIDKDLYLGLGLLKDLQKGLGQQLVLEREMRGPYQNMADFARRVPITEDQLTILIRIGAFRFTGKNKAQLLWDTKLYTRKLNRNQQAEVLFEREEEVFVLPELPVEPLEDAYDELELLSFPMCPPFSLIAERPPETILATEFPVRLTEEVRILGYLVCLKNIRTKKGDLMSFVNLIDEEGEHFDVTVFPKQMRHGIFSGRGVYLVEGKVVKEFGAYSIELSNLQKCAYRPDPRAEE
ncbi:MAG: DNA polymerase III subunit alpha [Bacteroidia bacterium]